MLCGSCSTLDKKAVVRENYSSQEIFKRDVSSTINKFNDLVSNKETMSNKEPEDSFTENRETGCSVSMESTITDSICQSENKSISHELKAVSSSGTTESPLPQKGTTGHGEKFELLENLANGDDAVKNIIRKHQKMIEKLIFPTNSNTGMQTLKDPCEINICHSSIHVKLFEPNNLETAIDRSHTLDPSLSAISQSEKTVSDSRELKDESRSASDESPLLPQKETTGHGEILDLIENILSSDVVKNIIGNQVIRNSSVHQTMNEKMNWPEISNVYMHTLKDTDVISVSQSSIQVKLFEPNNLETAINRSDTLDPSLSAITQSEKTVSDSRELKDESRSGSAEFPLLPQKETSNCEEILESVENLLSSDAIKNAIGKQVIGNSSAHQMGEEVDCRERSDTSMLNFKNTSESSISHSSTTAKLFEANNVEETTIDRSEERVVRSQIDPDDDDEIVILSVIEKPVRKKLSNRNRQPSLNTKSLFNFGKQLSEKMDGTKKSNVKKTYLPFKKMWDYSFLANGQVGSSVCDNETISQEATSNDVSGLAKTPKQTATKNAPNNDSSLTFKNSKDIDVYAATEVVLSPNSGALEVIGLVNFSDSVEEEKSANASRPLKETKGNEMKKGGKKQCGSHKYGSARAKKESNSLLRIHSQTKQLSTIEDRSLANTLQSLTKLLSTTAQPSNPSSLQRQSSKIQPSQQKPKEAVSEKVVYSRKVDVVKDSERFSCVTPTEDFQVVREKVNSWIDSNPEPSQKIMYPEELSIEDPKPDSNACTVDNLSNCTSCINPKRDRHDQCIQKITRSKHLQNHKDSMLSKKKWHNCRDCSFRTDRVADFQKHLSAEHHNEIKYKCDEYSTSKPSKLRRETRSVRPIKTVYRCPNCLHKALNDNELQRHRCPLNYGNHVHAYPCPHCDYKAEDSSYLQRHIFLEHDMRKVYKCPYCKYSAWGISSLRHHVDKLHSEKKSVRCPHCEYITPNTNDLQRHIFAYHAKKEPCQCRHCQSHSFGRDKYPSVDGKIPCECLHCKYNYKENNYESHHDVKVFREYNSSRKDGQGGSYQSHKNKGNYLERVNRSSESSKHRRPSHSRCGGEKRRDSDIDICSEFSKCERRSRPSRDKKNCRYPDSDNSPPQSKERGDNKKKKYSVDGYDVSVSNERHRDTHLSRGDNKKKRYSDDDDSSECNKRKHRRYASHDDNKKKRYSDVDDDSSECNKRRHCRYASRDKKKQCKCSCWKHGSLETRNRRRH